MTNILAFGLAGGGALTLVNNTKYEIYLRQVPIVAIWAFLTDITDPVEFSYEDPLPANSTSQPASWSIYSVGNSSTTDIFSPTMICCLGFITKEERREVNIDLANAINEVKIGDCSFTVETDLSNYDWTWPRSDLFYQGYQTVKVAVSENHACKWEN